MATRRPTRTVERRPATDGYPPLELVRSTRRRRSVTAFARDGVIVVQLPAGLAASEEERLVTRLVDKIIGRQRAREVGGDDELLRRASGLADRFVDGVRPASIAWSSRMTRRYGSCTPADGSIRISQELAAYPGYVLDAVVVHELAHLLHADHSPAFWEVVGRYPQLDRARGFLEGVGFGATGAPSFLDDADEVGGDTRSLASGA